MTELEAIQGLQNIVEYWTLNPHEQECARMAIAALQAQQNGGWISVKDRLPIEHDSMFKKFAGTSKWNPAMFKKLSDEVNVCGVYPDGKPFVTHSRTHDGKWNISSVFQMKITHWQSLPEPPKED